MAVSEVAEKLRETYIQWLDKFFAFLMGFLGLGALAVVFAFHTIPSLHKPDKKASGYLAMYWLVAFVSAFIGKSLRFVGSILLLECFWCISCSGMFVFFVSTVAEAYHPKTEIKYLIISLFVSIPTSFVAIGGFHYHFHNKKKETDVEDPEDKKKKEDEKKKKKDEDEKKKKDEDEKKKKDEEEKNEKKKKDEEEKNEKKKKDEVEKKEKKKKDEEEKKEKKKKDEEEKKNNKPTGGKIRTTVGHFLPKLRIHKGKNKEDEDDVDKKGEASTSSTSAFFKSLWSKKKEKKEEIIQTPTKKEIELPAFKNIGEASTSYPTDPIQTPTNNPNTNHTNQEIEPATPSTSDD